MDFAFTEEQELFRRTVREFATKELLPEYASWDKSEELPWRSLRRFAELGLTGIVLPKKYGGSEADFVTQGIACEECARGDFNRTFHVMNAATTGFLMAKFAQDELKEQWLPRMAGGEAILGGAITEPQCGSDAAALETRAVSDGDEYVLTGEKSSISFTYAHGFIVWATIDRSLGTRGITAFFLPSDTPGFGMSSFKDLGNHFVGRGALHLDRVRVPATHRLGEEGQGFHMLMSMFDFNRAVIALMCLGAALQTLDETIEYTKARTAFGQPIARFQGVAFRIAEAAAQIEAARLLTYKALWLADHGMPHSKEAAMAKALAPRLAYDVIHQCLLLHGHSGYSDDHPISQRLRDVIGMEIGDGTPEIMKIIVAQQLIGRQFRPS